MNIQHCFCAHRPFIYFQRSLVQLCTTWCAPGRVPVAFYCASFRLNLQSEICQIY